MSKIYKNIDNKPKPVVILTKAETTPPEVWDWSSFIKVPFVMNNLVKSNEEKLIVPFNLVDNSTNKKYNLTWHTYGGGTGLQYIGNLGENGHILNYQPYKEFLNKNHIFNSKFTQDQLDHGWIDYTCNSETNKWGAAGGASFSYPNGNIHFLNFGENNKLLYNPLPVNVNIPINYNPHNDGSSITIDNTYFSLGFNGIISGEGLSDYFNNIDNVAKQNQWFPLAIKGGCGNSITYNSTASCIVKLYSLNENDNDVTNYLLKKREIQNDVWYIEDDSFKDYTSTDAYYDTDIIITKIVSYMGEANYTYYNGSPYSYDTDYWTDNKANATKFSTVEQAMELRSHIPAARYTNYDVTDPTIPHINVSQPLSVECNNISIPQSNISGYVITATSGSQSVIYYGPRDTYTSIWTNYNGYDLDGTYFKTENDAKALTASMTTVLNPTVKKSGALMSFSDHNLKPPYFDFLTLNYIITPINQT